MKKRTRANYKSIITNYAYNVITQLLTIIVPLITMPYLSRILGTGGLGEYSFSYSVAYYFTIFIKLGLDNYGSREIAYVQKNGNELSNTFWNIYVFQLLMGIIVASIYLAYVRLLSENKTLGYIMFFVVLASLIDTNWCLYGLELFKATARRDVSIRIITTLLIFVFVKNAADVWKYSLIFSLGVFANNIITVFVVRKKIFWKRPNYVEAKRHALGNVKMLMPVLAVSIYMTMDKIMLGFFSDNNEVGYYHASENIIRVPLVMINALGTIMMPRISSMLKDSFAQDEYDDIFDKSLMFSMFVSTASSFGIMAIANVFVPFFYGNGFEKCIMLFYILLPSCPVIAFSSVLRTQFLLPKGEDRIYISSLWFGAFTNLIVNIILIPPMGSVGAAIGSVMAYSAVCLVQAIGIRNKIDIIAKIKYVIPFLIAGICMFMLTYSIETDFSGIIAIIIKIVLGASIYILGMIVMWLLNNFFKRNERYVK